jgi:hypothetical protein
MKMKNVVISQEVAENEWREFLQENDAEGLIPDEKEKGTSKDEIANYESKKTGFDKVVKAIMRGLITIDGDVIEQTLKYPIKGADTGEIIVGKLVYDQRLQAKDREEVMKGINTDDTSQAMLAQRRLCSKLTGVDTAILGKLDLSDAGITDKIVAVFFM